jgi:hypothetical protein
MPCFFHATTVQGYRLPSVTKSSVLLTRTAGSLVSAARFTLAGKPDLSGVVWPFLFSVVGAMHSRFVEW